MNVRLNITGCKECPYITGVSEMGYRYCSLRQSLGKIINSFHILEGCPLIYQETVKQKYQTEGLQNNIHIKLDEQSTEFLVYREWGFEESMTKPGKDYWGGTLLLQDKEIFLQHPWDNEKEKYLTQKELHEKVAQFLSSIAPYWRIDYHDSKN